MRSIALRDDAGANGDFRPDAVQSHRNAKQVSAVTQVVSSWFRGTPVFLFACLRLAYGASLPHSAPRSPPEGGSLAQSAEYPRYERQRTERAGHSAYFANVNRTPHARFRDKGIRQVRNLH